MVNDKKFKGRFFGLKFQPQLLQCREERGTSGRLIWLNCLRGPIKDEIEESRKPGSVKHRAVRHRWSTSSLRVVEPGGQSLHGGVLNFKPPINKSCAEIVGGRWFELRPPFRHHKPVDRLVPHLAVDYQFEPVCEKRPEHEFRFAIQFFLARRHI